MFVFKNSFFLYYYILINVIFTVQAIIISLLVIIGIHYLITNIYLMKKYKNKMKKKVIFKLPQEEDEKLESEM